MTIAFWSVLVAALLPYVAYQFARGGLNPRLPRVGLDQLDGRAQRAHGAHLNAFETFPPFAAAVIIAHVVEGPSGLVNGLAALYIAVRLGHLAAYLADHQPARSAAFGLGWLIVIAIFVQAAWR